MPAYIKAGELRPGAVVRCRRTCAGCRKSLGIGPYYVCEVLSDGNTILKNDSGMRRAVPWKHVMVIGFARN